MKKYQRPPTLIEKKYREKLFEILDANNVIYELLKNAKTTYEVETIFINELKNRYKYIKSYIKSVEISNCKNIFDIFPAQNDEFILNHMKNYFFFLQSTNLDFIVHNSIEIKHISLHELLFGRIWSTDYLKKIMKSCKHHNYFLEEYEILHVNPNHFDLYINIKNDLIDFISNNIDIYKEFCKEWYGHYYDETKISIKKDFLDFWLEDKIFMNLKKTIRLLENCNLLDKYINSLQKMFILCEPINNIETKSNKIDIGQWRQPNKIATVTLNFNYSLETLQNELKNIYQFMQETDELDYSLLFNQTFDPREEIIKSPGNKSTIYDCLNNKYENIVDKSKKKLTILSEYLSLQLFIFDSYFFGASASNIENALDKIYFNDSLNKNGVEYFSTKSKLYEILLNIITNQDFTLFSNGKIPKELLCEIWEIYNVQT